MKKEVMKFPVTSSITGKEYKITVTYQEYGYGLFPDWIFKLYELKGVNFFGKPKFERVMTRSFDACGEKAFHGDFVQATKDLVTKYESEMMELQQQNDFYSKGIADFDKWDGVV